MSTPFLGPRYTLLTSVLDSHAKRTLENTYAAEKPLTLEESTEIWKIINSHEVKGDRYFGPESERLMHLWG